MAILRDVLVRLGVQFKSGDKATLDDFKQSLETVRNGTAAIAAGAIAAGAGIAALTFEYANNADAAIKAARAIGISVEEYTALTAAAAKAGLSVEQVDVALKTAARNLATFASTGTGEAAEGLKILGLELDDLTGPDGKILSVADSLPLIADALTGVDEELKGAALSRIFGESGAALVNLLDDGAKGLEELTRAAEQAGLVISTDAAEAAEDFNDALTDLGNNFRGFLNNIGPDLIRAGQRFIELADDATSAILPWVEGLVDLIDSTVGLEAALAGLAAVAGAFSAITGVLTAGIGVAGLAGSFGALSAAASAVAGAFASIGIVGAGPILLAIGAAVAAIAVSFAQLAAIVGGFILVVDDLAAFIRGGNSVFEEWLRATGLSEEGIEQLRTTINDLIPVLFSLFELGQAFSGFLFTFVGEVLTVAVNTFLDLVGVLALTIDTIGEFLGLETGFVSFLQGVSGSVGTLTEFIDGLIAGLNQASDAVAGFSELGGGGLIAAGANLLGFGGDGGTVNNSTNINETTASIQVNGAGDPGAVASEVAGQIEAASSLTQGSAL